MKESLLNLKMELQADADKAAGRVQVVDSALKEFDASEAKHAKELTAAEESGFEKGLAQAGQAGGSDKLYSDAELNAELAPLKEKIATLEAAAEADKEVHAEHETKVQELQAQIDELTAKEAKSEDDQRAAVESARKELRAQFVADVKAADVDNQAMVAKYSDSTEA